ncbi:helix-turn-helix domain-containing protein [Nocardioides secundeburneus]
MVNTATSSSPASHEPPAREPLLDLRALATWLSLSEHTVRKWASKGPESGLLPPMLRINGQLRFRPDDVRTWLEHQEVR